MTAKPIPMKPVMMPAKALLEPPSGALVPKDWAIPFRARKPSTTATIPRGSDAISTRPYVQQPSGTSANEMIPQTIEAVAPGASAPMN